MFIDLLRIRRSFRQFTPQKIAREAVDILIEAALRAPSSRGINPWEFILVDDPETIRKLAKAKQHGSDFLKNAPLAIVVCADSTKSDVWVEDCSIAAIVIQLTAVSLGLGSCWAQMRNRQHDDVKSAEKYVQEVLGLPEQVKVTCIIGIGHPAEQKTPLPEAALQRDKIRWNRWA
ncbi:nitroreductase family protein [Pelotalea chapellei]|uniref:Nitroreductase family protein n=1 Tax=Pelotalea chapellei TaxID=44671 RepID=A0ABS5UB72_9BACT|nr:nitroreductase family protein [Pelotalea chapellei]MBT1072932.1 nitroreductase family protein [Pelotalea chapellei]